MSIRVSCDECIENEYGIFFSCYMSNGLCFIPKNMKEATLLTNFAGYSLLRGRLYKVIVEIENKLFLAPCSARHIAVYDMKTRKVDMIALHELPLKSERNYKFWTSIHWGRTIYFIAHYYPAIIKMNIDTMELEYIDDWLDELNEKTVNEEAYFTDGVVVGEYAYLPSCCANIILKLELSTGKCEMIQLNTSEMGFNGIQYINNCFWLVARNSHKILIWEVEKNGIREIDLGYDEGDRYLGFHTPLLYRDKLILAPIRAKHFYCMDVNSLNIDIINELDYVYSLEPIDDCTCKDVTINPYIQGNCMKFISGVDYKWHIWNLDTRKEVVNEIVADSTFERYIRRSTCLEQWNRQRKNDGIVYEKEGYSCDDFVDLVKVL